MVESGWKLSSAPVFSSLGLITLLSQTAKRQKPRPPSVSSTPGVWFREHSQLLLCAQPCAWPCQGHGSDHGSLALPSQDSPSSGGDRSSP